MNNLFRLHLDNLQRSKTPVKPPEVSNAAGTASIYIYDIISADYGVGAEDVISALDACTGVKTVNMHIHSPGGDVFESRAIIAAIDRFDGQVVAHIDGLAASAATSIALAADEVVMAESALFMIHNAKGMVWGDKTAMRDTADLLEKVEGSIVNDYTTKTGKDAAEIAALMNAETWMTAQEALDGKFIDRIAAKAAKPSNAWNLSAFSKAPVAQEETAPEPTPVPDGTTQTNANRMRLAMIA